MATSLTASSLLQVSGWNQVTPLFREKFIATPRKVVIFPHTTHWDFVVMLAYIMSEESRLSQHIYTVMKPQMFERPFGDFFRSLNCIPSTRLEEGGSGFIAQMVKRFCDFPEFTLLIAPEGTTRRAPWRSGYFHLAKGLKCPIQVIGLDYHQHTLMAFDPVTPTTLDATQEHLQRQMSQIPTLYPEASIVSSPPVTTRLYNANNFVVVLCLIVALIAAYYASSYLFILLLCTLFVVILQ